MGAEEEIQQGTDHAGRLARLKELLAKQFDGWQAEGTQTLRIGSATIAVAYGGQICRRYAEEYCRPYRAEGRAPMSIEVAVCESFPIGFVRDTTLWEDGGRVFLGRWDFFVEIDAASRRARAVVSHEAEFFSVDSTLRVAVGAFAEPEQCTLLHGMASVRGEIGIVGSARGRGGKSTSARLLRAQGWRTLCDDLPAIHEQDGRFLLSGTPFWSYREADFRFANFTAQIVPLRAIFLLEKGPKVSVERCSPASAAGTLMRNILHYPADEAIGVAKFRLAARLLETTPVLRLSFLRDELPEEVVLRHIG